MESFIKIGTRKSPLAQWQAQWVANQLDRGGVASELVLIQTKGDRMLNVPIPEIGSKGVFTEEIEDQLSDGSIDIAVHSAKDMPSELPLGFEIIAYTAREQAHDVLVSFKDPLTLTKPLMIGTSSSRRIAMFKRYYPKITTCMVRGNLQTRLKKLKEGRMDALALAYAGVYRMGMESLIKQELPLTEFVPAVGQGCMAIEVSTGLDHEKRSWVRGLVNDITTEYCLITERAFLSTLKGGCSVPAFAYAQLSDRIVNIHGGIISLDGKRLVQLNLQGDINDAQRLGKDLGDKILQAGGAEILQEIRSQMNH